MKWYRANEEVPILVSIIVTISSPNKSGVIQAQIKENIKALGHWPVCEEFTETGEFPAQMASNAENVSIWWRLMRKSNVKSTSLSMIDHCILMFFVDSTRL